MRNIFMFIAAYALFSGIDKNDRRNVEDVSYKLLRATILRDSVDFVKCVDINRLTENINKQKLDSQIITTEDIYHLFIFRYSPWKITKRNLELLSKTLTRDKLKFSGYKTISNRNCYIH